MIESEATGFESRPALALEIEAHDAFARERAPVFGREEVLTTIAEYLRAGGDRPLVLHGASGSGKSAVMAQASERAQAVLPSWYRHPGRVAIRLLRSLVRRVGIRRRASLKPGPASTLAGPTSAVVIRRFIGASPESSNGLTLLRGLSDQIGGAYGASKELPVDFVGVARVFHECLALATSGRPLAVFLDAVDQLEKDDPARSLNWLGGALPPRLSTIGLMTLAGSFSRRSASGFWRCSDDAGGPCT